MRLNTSVIHQVVSTYISDPVKVKIVEGTDRVGLAGYDEDGYFIELHQRSGGDRWGELGHLFLHELGHIALGHVPKRVPDPEVKQYDRRDAVEALRDGADNPEFLRGVLDRIDLIEQQAEEFVARELHKWDHEFRPWGLSRALLIPEDTRDRQLLGEEMPIVSRIT